MKPNFIPRIADLKFIAKFTEFYVAVALAFILGALIF